MDVRRSLCVVHLYSKVEVPLLEVSEKIDLLSAWLSPTRQNKNEFLNVLIFRHEAINDFLVRFEKCQQPF